MFSGISRRKQGCRNRGRCIVVTTISLTYNRYSFDKMMSVFVSRTTSLASNVPRYSTLSFQTRLTSDVFIFLVSSLVDYSFCLFGDRRIRTTFGRFVKFLRQRRVRTLSPTLPYPHRVPSSRWKRQVAPGGRSRATSHGRASNRFVAPHDRRSRENFKLSRLVERKAEGFFSRRRRLRRRSTDATRSRVRIYAKTRIVKLNYLRLRASNGENSKRCTLRRSFLFRSSSPFPLHCLAPFLPSKRVSLSLSFSVLEEIRSQLVLLYPHASFLPSYHEINKLLETVLLHSLE